MLPMANKSAIWILAFVLFIGIASAARIQGEVYNLDLDLQKDVIVEIDTKPNQQMIAKEGAYEFEVPQGTYTLSARYAIDGVTRYSAEYSLEVEQDGDYTVDLILFPAFDEEEEIIGGIEEGIDVEEERNWVPYMIAAAIAAIAVYLLLKRKKREEGPEEREEAVKNELRDIIQFINKAGGRTTQKDIRQQFPQSEAKISLIIAELEDKGIVKKIKKGRGNIIILNK